MFKKFSRKEDASPAVKMMSSKQRAIRAKIQEEMPLLSENEGQALEQLWPKGEALHVVKRKDNASIYLCKNRPIFFQDADSDSPFYPTLQVLHQLPGLLPHVQVDRGAIRFVLSGANIMIPGMTSAGGRLPDDISAHKAVAVHAEGKEHAVAIGLTKMSTREMKQLNKGMGIDLITFLGDDLYKLPTFS